MSLDLPTIYAAIAVACLAIGLVQILTYITGRFERWPIWWGSSNLLIGTGSLMLALSGLVPSTIVVLVSDVLTVVGYALLFGGVRSFAGRRFPRWSWGALAYGVAMACILPAPSAFAYRISLFSLLFAVWDTAISFEAYRLNRREGLRSAWLMIGAFLPTSVIFVVRAALGLTGHLGQGSLAAAHSPVHAWLAVIGAAFVVMRSMCLLLLSAERNRRDLLLLAHTDPLTGASNRAGLLEGARALRSRVTSASVLAIDIDHFKRLNDTSGHAAGDEILCRVRTSIGEAMRPGDLLGRWGGDEFVLLLPDTSRRDALAVARDVQQRFATVAGDASVTLSIGCAMGPLPSADFLPLLKQADEALYASKRLGRNRISFADDQPAEGVEAVKLPQVA